MTRRSTGQNTAWRVARFLLPAFLAIGAIACDERDSYPLPTNPLFDPATMMELLPSENLPDPQFHGGYQIELRQPLDEPYACKQSRSDPADVFWTLRTPRSAGRQAKAAVIFTIFPSNEAARDAWSRNNGTLPCDFHRLSSRSIEFLRGEWLEGRRPPCPARLTEGSVLVEARFGYSTGESLVGNVIVRTQRISSYGYVKNHADADTAIELLHGVEVYIAELLQKDPAPGSSWPFSFVPCS
jgi:hypothetical protein